MKISKKWLLRGGLVLAIALVAALAFGLSSAKALSAGSIDSLAPVYGCTFEYQLTVTADPGIGDPDVFFLQIWDDGTIIHSEPLMVPEDGAVHTLSGFVALAGPPAGGAAGVGVVLYDDGAWWDIVDPWMGVDGCDASQNSSSDFMPARPQADVVANPFRGVSYNGMTACGIFEVKMWGVKTIDPAAFAACADYTPEELMVACFTKDGAWTTANVASTWAKEALLYADIRQHGTCGIFPK
ncbi:MAG: hypothetical protein Kow00124_25730 [Anaerolineae bacterium]